MSETSITSKSELMTPSGARRLFRYNEHLFDRYERRIRKIPWEEASRSRDIGHLSLFQTLVHILEVHEVWIGHIVQGRNSDPELQKLFEDPARKPRDWRGFSKYRRRVWSTVNGYLESLKPEDMPRRVSAPWMPGRYSVSDALMQTTFEQAHHLGEIIGALWQQDIEPPGMTWIDIGRRLMEN